MGRNAAGNLAADRSLAADGGCVLLGPRTPDAIIAVKDEATPESPRSSAAELADVTVPLHAYITGFACDGMPSPPGSAGREHRVVWPFGARKGHR